MTELKALKDDNIPEFENRNFGYALHAGLGTGSFAGTLGSILVHRLILFWF